MRFSLWYFFGKRRRKGKTHLRAKENPQKTVNKKPRKGKVLKFTHSKIAWIQLKNQGISKAKVNSRREEKTLANKKNPISSISLTQTKNRKIKGASTTKIIKKEKTWGRLERNVIKKTKAPRND